MQIIRQLPQVYTGDLMQASGKAAGFRCLQSRGILGRSALIISQH
jgi:hypothetical protein